MGYFKNLLIEREEESILDESFEVQEEKEIIDDWEAFKREEQLSEKSLWED